MKVSNIFIFTGAFIFILNVNAQSDPAYRQNQFNAMVLNPAQTGANERNEIVIDASKAWVGLEGAPQSISATGNFNLTEQVGVGVSAVNDELGPVKTNRFGISAAYHLQLNKNWIASVGLSGMLSNVVIDLPSLSTTVLNDPHMQSILNTGAQLRAGYGGLIYRKDFYFGFSQPIIGKVNFMNSGMDNFIQSPSFVAYSGGDITMNEDWHFRPNVLYRYVEAFAPYVDVTAMFTYDDKIDLGATYQLNGSVGAMIGLEVSKSLYIGYAYTYPTTELNRVTSQIHEVSMRVKFGKSKNSWGFQNPRFFN
jgi:type IX secretion system PorP/SprF family membrane protein